MYFLPTRPGNFKKPLKMNTTTGQPLCSEIDLNRLRNKDIFLGGEIPALGHSQMASLAKAAVPDRQHTAHTVLAAGRSCTPTPRKSSLQYPSGLV